MTYSSAQYTIHLPEKLSINGNTNLPITIQKLFFLKYISIICLALYDTFTPNTASKSIEEIHKNALDRPFLEVFQGGQMNPVHMTTLLKHAVKMFEHITYED